jgi:hypothetical protein
LNDANSHVEPGHVYSIMAHAESADIDGRELSKQPQDDEDEDEHEQHMNDVPRSRNLRDSCRAKVAEKPEHDEDDDEELEHGPFPFHGRERIARDRPIIAQRSF